MKIFTDRGTNIIQYIAGAILAIALVFLIAGEAECVWCADVPCFNSQSCAPGCLCLIPGGEVTGSCVSLGVE